MWVFGAYICTRDIQVCLHECCLCDPALYLRGEEQRRVETCESVAHGEGVLGQRLSCGCCPLPHRCWAQCPTTATHPQPSAGANLLVPSVGHLALLNSFSTHLNRAAQDPSAPSLPDGELADYSLMVPLAHTLGRRRWVTSGKRPKDPFWESCLAQEGVPTSWMTPDPSPASSLRLGHSDRAGPWNPSFRSLLGKPKQNQGAIIFTGCN